LKTLLAFLLAIPVLALFLVCAYFATESVHRYKRLPDGRVKVLQLYTIAGWAFACLVSFYALFLVLPG
jgi:hypothetical protein